MADVVKFVREHKDGVIAADIYRHEELKTKYTPTSASNALHAAYTYGYLDRRPTTRADNGKALFEYVPRDTVVPAAHRPSRTVEVSDDVAIEQLTVRFGNQTLTLRNGQGERARDLFNLIYGPAKEDPQHASAA